MVSLAYARVEDEISSSSFESMDSEQLDSLNEQLWETFGDTQNLMTQDHLSCEVSTIHADDLNVDESVEPLIAEGTLLPTESETLEASAAATIKSELTDMPMPDFLNGPKLEDLQQIELTRMYKKKLREAATLRLKRKRDEHRMSGKGARYAGRKKSAEARPRVNGRFVKRGSGSSASDADH
mmetsp:Transcript_302/g.708  ORF Transcript_302/g.708 Transcript_302/m.708 type:complete len:182 (-) Transcript_302:185-730(-)|eukprot:CAMPEP_0113964162 /NCGR_PEP_ID=MMETSP0011_2-20120614/6962_1 /TAXON_ID=101924 /ORGANISM="Rhodosorus marinus" /LENGTH=181 /DNA_ID=CAMNT_0000976385 /DNA_START=86 /DNA_END=631 /DNA_ORIENTATION=+ /assembly_acc=CAM_ASM_000156